MQSKQSLVGWLRWVLIDADRTARCRSLLCLVLGAAVVVMVAAVALAAVLVSRVPASGDYLCVAGGLVVGAARTCVARGRRNREAATQRNPE